MTTSIPESNQSFIDVFHQLGKAFQELSKTSIIPNKLLSLPLEGREKEIKEIEGVIAKNIKKGGHIKSLGMKTRIGSVESKREVKISNEINIDEEKESETVKNDEYESADSDEDCTEESNASFNTLNTGLIFVDKQGWEFKIKICNFIVEMGPFISRKKARSTITKNKKNEPLLRKMSISERKRWIKSLSSLVETLLI